MTRRTDFRFTVKTEGRNGLPLPSRSPQAKELSALAKDNPRTIVGKVGSFLEKQYGVTPRSSLKSIPDSQGAYPEIYILGNPYVVKDPSDKRGVVVAQVLNQVILGWGKIPQIPVVRFGRNSRQPKFYGADAHGGQFYVLDNLTAGTLFNGLVAEKRNKLGSKNSDWIFINAHQRNLRSALYHELLHTFEPEYPLFSTVFFVEGSVEYFSRSFLVWRDRIDPANKPKPFVAYAACDAEIGKLVRQTSEKTCAQVFLGNDSTVLKRLLPMFDLRIRKYIDADNQLTEDAIIAGFKERHIKDGVSPLGQPGKPPIDWDNPFQKQEQQDVPRWRIPDWYKEWRSWDEYKEVAARMEKEHVQLKEDSVMQTST